ncbi:uncharacterized protein [Centruroides vittatus]
MGVVIIGVPAAEVCVLLAIKNISVAISLILLTLIFIGFNIYCFISVYLYYEDFYKSKRSRKHHRNKRSKRKIHHSPENIEEITKFTKDDVEDGVRNISPEPSKLNKSNEEELEKPKKLRSSRKRKHKSSAQNVRLEEPNLKSKRSRKMASSKGISKNKSKKTLPIHSKLNSIPESQANSSSKTIPVPIHQEM